jgi:hypothetical protein
MNSFPLRLGVRRFSEHWLQKWNYNSCGLIGADPTFSRNSRRAKSTQIRRLPGTLFRAARYSAKRTEEGALKGADEYVRRRWI